MAFYFDRMPVNVWLSPSDVRWGRRTAKYGETLYRQRMKVFAPRVWTNN